jgi:predicted GTPase
MRTLIAGEGGSVLVAAATNAEASALACEGLGHATHAPSGLPVYPADALPDDLDVDEVVVLHCEAWTRERIVAWAEAHAKPVRSESVNVLPAPDGVRVVAVSAPSTGSGKTATVRRVARALRASGMSVAVARHPIANLLLWGRFSPAVMRSPGDLSTPRPLEEREELAPLVGAGIPVVTGLDAEGVLRSAAREAGTGGVVVWDGGGSAAPWVEPDVHLVVVDLLRPPLADPDDRIARADGVILAKADSGDPESMRATEERVRSWNPDVPITMADLSVGVGPTGVLNDRAVVCIEDWSALSIGGLKAGAGAVAARRFRCGMVDPRPFAVGTIRDALVAFPHIGPVIPSLGRTEQEIADLAASVRATPGQVVLWASNADPATVVPDEQRPIVRAFGELTEVSGPSLQERLASVLPGH